MAKNSPKQRSPFKKVRKYSLKAIQLILIFMIMDIFSTTIAIKVLDIAEEQNPIANALWEEFGFTWGTIFLTTFNLSGFIFLYFGVMFAPVKKPIGKGFLIFSGGYLCVRIVLYMLVLVNNYAILTEFFLSKI